MVAIRRSTAPDWRAVNRGCRRHGHELRTVIVVEQNSRQEPGEVDLESPRGRPCLPRGPKGGASGLDADANESTRSVGVERGLSVSVCSQVQDESKASTYLGPPATHHPAHTTPTGRDAPARRAAER